MLRAVRAVCCVLNVPVSLQKPEMTNYVIVGTGVAGIGAAEAIRSVDAHGTITFISEDLHGYYSRPGLAYYLTGEVDEKLLFPLKPGDLKKLNAHFSHGNVVRIYPQKHQVELLSLTQRKKNRLQGKLSL